MLRAGALTRQARALRAKKCWASLGLRWAQQVRRSGSLRARLRAHERHKWLTGPQVGSQAGAAPGTLRATTRSSTVSAQMKQHLAVSAIGSDRTGMVHELTRVISECGGNITESRMASLGTEFAMLLLVSGNWHALAKLETELKRLAETNGMSVHLKRTEPRSPRTDMLPYSIDVVCLDQSGIVSGLSGFFSSRGIDIAEVSTRSYPAAHTGAPMFSVQMIVNVPSRIHVAHLREEFMEFCDSLNLDAILEPVKS